jgi:hypothetical protein
MEGMKPSMPTTSAASEPRRHVAAQLLDQARSCRAMGSPLYATLLDRAAADVLRGGPVWSVLADDVRPGRGDAVALRFMAAVHRLVLAGEAGELAAHYPSVGGTRDPDRAWPAFARLVEDRSRRLSALTALPCQTNEVGRCAALVGGFLAIARGGLPLRLLEVGASAGLNLRWDHYRYGGGGRAWGPEDSPVRMPAHWLHPPPVSPAAVEVARRQGCDPHPIDPASEDGRLALGASVWADQPERLARLRAACAVALDVPAEITAASVADWLPAQLAHPVPGAATVVFHSVVDEYLADDARAGFHEILADAGLRATDGAPLAWLRLEPVTALRTHGVTLTTWPGGEARLLATCHAHGTDVSWRG